MYVTCFGTMKATTNMKHVQTVLEDDAIVSASIFNRKKAKKTEEKLAAANRHERILFMQRAPNTRAHHVEMK